MCIMQQFAWVTYADTPAYLNASLVLCQSLHDVRTMHPFVLMTPYSFDCGTHLPKHIIHKQVHPFNKTHTSHANARYNACSNKVHCWDLEEYDKVCWLDSDVLVLRNIDHVFDVHLPSTDWIAAAPGCRCNIFNNPKLVTCPELCPFNDPTNIYINAGVILLKPDRSISLNLRKQSYDHPFGEQDTFNIYFRNRIQVISTYYNYLNHISFVHVDVATSADKNIYAYHFGYGKPWEKNTLRVDQHIYDRWCKYNKSV